MQTLNLHPCISLDTLAGTIALTLIDELGRVRYAESVASSLSIRAAYLITRCAVPSLPEWDAISSLMTRQYDLLLQDRQRQAKDSVIVA